jgi:cytoskeletal protein CcmA (bactofilin family)
MWRKDEPQSPSLPAQTKKAPVATISQTPRSTPTEATTFPPGSSVEGRLTQSLVIEGEITGQGDLLIDGEVRGKVRLLGGKLSIGPDGRVTADIEAREVVVRGEVRGNVNGYDRVQIAATGKVIGEISTKSISIEDGAEVHGLRVNLGKEERRPAGSIGADSKPDNKVQVPPAERVSQVHV